MKNPTLALTAVAALLAVTPPLPARDDSWANKTGRNMAREARNVPTQFTEENLVWEIVYLVDFAGFLNCWDAQTGESIYKFDVGASVKERSQLVTDGKIYVCINIGFLQVIKAGREPELISSTRFKHHLSTVEVADGLLLAVSPRDAFLYHTNSPDEQHADL